MQYLMHGCSILIWINCINKQRNNLQRKSVVMCCKESDEPIVAMILRPMKLGNKSEDKTQLAKGF